MCKNKYYQYFYVASIVYGAVATLEAALALIDGMYALLTIPTIFSAISAAVLGIFLGGATFLPIASRARDHMSILRQSTQSIFNATIPTAIPTNPPVI